MGTATAAANLEAAAQAHGHSFFWRRLHSLSGIVPIGAFVIEHMLSNAAVLTGNPVQSYGDQVKFLNSLPLVLGLEIAFIYVPLLFHGIYGLYITRQADPNVVRYFWWGNWGYLWQRITAPCSSSSSCGTREF